MHTMSYPPSSALKPYIICHWVYSADRENAMEVLYPSGYLELAINISTGKLTTILKGKSISMPSIEVLGQLTSPGTIKAAKGTTLLITRFHPYASSFFFPNGAADFTDDSVDLSSVLGKDANDLYDKVMEQSSITEKIGVVENFFVSRFATNQGKLKKMRVVEKICAQITSESNYSLKRPRPISDYSDRYLQKMFLDFTGMTAKKFRSIQRFKRSMSLMQSPSASLTSIALDCGYYDQSHFIREFRAFTGVAPSKFNGSNLRD